MKHNVEHSLFNGKVISRVKFPLHADQSIETPVTYFYSKTCDPWSVKPSNVTMVILAYKCGQEVMQRETYRHLTACTACNKWAVGVWGVTWPSGIHSLSCPYLMRQVHSDIEVLISSLFCCFYFMYLFVF